MPRVIPQLIDGQWQASHARELIEVTDPATQEVLALAPKATHEEIEAAIASAKKAFLAWREVPVPERARLMLRYQHLLKEHHDELAEILAGETGKTFADAKGDVWRGIEVAEHAANICSLMMGETVENVAREIDTASYIQPLGVCVGITPFNFPAMIPLWMFPLAIACGNTFILKPSEQDPLTPNRLAELFLEAGAPAGVLQVLHGGREVVDALLTHEDIRAISFVGSVPVGQHIYRTGTQHLKRVQAFAGAKNHMVIMPDAPKDQVISNLVGASCGAAGQRCMAISVAVFVGESRQWIPELAAQMAELRPGHWRDSGAAFGPLISQQARQRVLRLIAEGKAEGAECLHVIDLGAAFGEGDSREAILAIARNARVPVQAGGGLRDEDGVALLLAGGIARVILGTRALRDPEFLARSIDRHGRERVMVAIDCLGDEVRVAGWEEGGFPIERALARVAEAGADRLLVTATDRDGTLAGPRIELVRRVLDASVARVVATSACDVGTQTTSLPA